MWNAAKTVLGVKFIALNAYVGNKKTYWINNLHAHPKKLEQEEQNKPKAIRRKEAMKIRA